jgi:hypothetical protein
MESQREPASGRGTHPLRIGELIANCLRNPPCFSGVCYWGKGHGFSIVRKPVTVRKPPHIPSGFVGIRKSWGIRGTADSTDQ